MELRCSSVVEYILRERKREKGRERERRKDV
jgi:hypothetical protein